MKNIKFVSWILFFSCGLFFACEKNNLNPIDNQLDLDKIVIAGSNDSNGIYNLYTPTIKIIEKETGCLFYSGFDSIDVDNNGNYDLKFQSRSQVPDLIGECCDCPDDPDIFCDCWPSGRIYKFIQTIEVNFQIACDSSNRAISFELNDTIEIWRNWINNNWITLIDVYNFPPPETIYGNWNSIDDRYLGVRKIDTDTLYGWIKINLSETIEIKEIYLEKQ